VTRKALVWLLYTVLVIGLAASIVTHGMGFTSRAAPSSLEARLMRGARHWATPTAVRREANPVAATDELLHEAMTHWADHCATCHANDGSGRASMGRSLYPPVPEMRSADTQGLTDGELFYIIERGVPFTGMPAWGSGMADGERQSWGLVRFIRHLPQLSDKELMEMAQLNPKSAAQIEQERRIEDFLKGKGEK